MRHPFLPACFISFAALCITLAGCGGGGSSRSPAPATPPAPASNAAPNANLQITPAAGGAAPLTVTVSAAGSSDSDGSIERYSWDFGDGGSSIGETAQHTFTDPGTFTIRLSVTDDDDATATASSDLQVTANSGTANLSGTISILGSSAVDADVHDRLTTTSSNNSFDDAQSLPNPVTLGGFANRPNTGADTGNLFASGDPGDFYRINLTGNEIILLTIAEGDADLDLRLYASDRTLLDASVGDNNTESLTVNVAGSYFIEIVPVAGASNYNLSVGLDVTSAALPRADLARISDPFVTGELLLEPHGTEALKRFGPALMRLQASPSAPQSANNRASKQLAFGNRGSTSLSSRASAILSAPELAQLPPGSRASSEQRARLETLLKAKALRRTGEWRAAEPNGIRKPQLTPNDPFYDFQWHYRSVGLPLAWDVTTGSTDVIVAVVDTGVLVNHPDLNDRLIAGYDFIADATRARDGNGLDANPDDPGDLAFGGSSSFHGTHVAGTIGAESNNASGATGVDWQARIMPLRALGLDGGTTYDVIQAMRYAAGLSNDSNTTPAERADIINLSLGSEFASQSEQNTLNEIRNLGVIMVASAGNESSNLPSYPAAYDGVISVSATTISNAFADYSNFGPSIDVAAPGGNNGTDLNGDGIGDGVVSSIGEDGSAGPIEFGYAALNGTSMAAPHVAGIAALMKAVHPALTPAEFDTALLAGDLTDDLGAPGRDDQFGHGLINAQKAVIAALELANGQGSDPGPVLSGSASSLNFGAFGTELELTLANVGTGTISVAQVTSSEPWLTVVPATVDTNGLGSYSLQVDRTGLPDGAYSATVNVDSDTNDLQVSVIMQVASANQAADAGLHYVILVDSDGSSNLPAAVVSVQNGEYTFSMTDVPFGQYRVFGGTDADDDNFLCDDGEACGAYRTLDAPETLSINGDVSGIDFVSSFRSSIGSLSNANATGSETAPASDGIAFQRADEQHP